MGLSAPFLNKSFDTEDTDINPNLMTYDISDDVNNNNTLCIQTLTSYWPKHFTAHLWPTHAGEYVFVKWEMVMISGWRGMWNKGYMANFETFLE
jgi:hypothetical protein